MGVETKQVYTCDIGGLQGDDPAGWVQFTLSMTAPGSAGGPPVPVEGVEPPADDPYRQRMTLACPEHAPQVLAIISAALEQIAAETPAPTPV